MLPMHHLGLRFRSNGIKAMSRGISRGKEVRKFANTGNRGHVCLFYQNKMMINSHHEKCTVRV